MKKLITILFPLLLTSLHAQQIPWTVQEGPETFNSGTATGLAPYEFHMPLLTPGPVLYTQDINGDVTAADRVHLGPGFRSGNFSNSTIFNPYFHAQIGAPADFEIVYLQPNSHYPQVGQFEKLEMGIRLPGDLEYLVNTYFLGSSGLNPFNPDEISLEATFQNGINVYTVYGFYYDEFIRDPASIVTFDPQSPTPANWLPQPTDYNWRIRFSPPFLGQWKCSVAIRIGNALTCSYAVNGLSFNCVSSSNPGYLKVGNDNRHLAYSGSNESFFALAQNIAWNDPMGSNNTVVFRGGQPIPSFNRLMSGGYMDILDWIENLADNGGNMVRVNTIGWNYELEIEHLNDYKDRLDNAWELDRLFELCEEKNMKVTFSFADRRFSETNGNPLMNWDNNPYHMYIAGVNSQRDFLTNAEAQKIFKKKIRYFMSRWGYSTSLGILDMMGEFNDQELDLSNNAVNEDLVDWADEMMLFAKDRVPYRKLLMTSSYLNFENPIFNPAIFDNASCDLTNLHSYHNDRRANHMRFDEFNQQGINRGVLQIWETKPGFFEEMGNCPDPGCGADPNDIEGCSDIGMHNTLWSTAFMGGLGTGYVWWQWFNNDYREANYPALHAFFDGVDFQSISFNDPDFWDDSGPLHDPVNIIDPCCSVIMTYKSSTVETFYVRDESKNRVMGWVHNTSYWWGNIDATCSDRNNSTMNLPIDDDDPSVTQSISLTTEFEVHNLNNMASYTVDIYSTRFSGGIYHTQNAQSNILGTLKPHYPGFDADYAFKAYRPGNNFRLMDEITYDTLRCEEDTIQAYGNHEMDTLNNFSYHWDFGNGQASSEKNAIAVYNYPGTYLVTLIASDTSGWSDTLQQYLVKPNCESGRKGNPMPIESIDFSWQIFPNPTTSEISISFDSSWTTNIHIAFYSIDGILIFEQDVSNKEKSGIPVMDFPTGVFIVRAADQNKSESKRFVICR